MAHGGEKLHASETENDDVRTGSTGSFRMNVKKYMTVMALLKVFLPLQLFSHVVL